jgi:PIN domain nuclease of toxin-antitoxin system
MFYSESGCDRVADLIRGALLSSVNLAEVQTKLLLDGAAEELVRKRIASLTCEICLFDAEQAQIASEMIWQTRPHGLSLGDRACLALGIQRGATVYTADRAWANLSLGVKVEVIR